MWKCPVCNKEVTSPACPDCGYANYLSYKTYLGLTPLSAGQKVRILALQKQGRERAERELLKKIVCQHCSKVWYILAAEEDNLKVCPFCQKEYEKENTEKELETLNALLRRRAGRTDIVYTSQQIRLIRKYADREYNPAMEEMVYIFEKQLKNPGEAEKWRIRLKLNTEIRNIVPLIEKRSEKAENIVQQQADMSDLTGNSAKRREENKKFISSRETQPSNALVRAAGQGDKEAQTRLACLYRERQQNDEFFYWIIKAASKGSADAQRILAETYLNEAKNGGNSAAGKISKAIEWLRKAADTDTEYCMLLAEIYTRNTDIHRQCVYGDRHNGSCLCRCPAFPLLPDVSQRLKDISCIHRHV